MSYTQGPFFSWSLRERAFFGALSTSPANHSSVTGCYTANGLVQHCEKNHSLQSTHIIVQLRAKRAAKKKYIYRLVLIRRRGANIFLSSEGGVNMGWKIITPPGEGKRKFYPA